MIIPDIHYNAGSTQSDHVPMEEDGTQVDSLDRVGDNDNIAMREQPSDRASELDRINGIGGAEGTAEGDDDAAVCDEDMQRLLAWARFFSQFERLNEMNSQRLERLVQHTRRESQ